MDEIQTKLAELEAVPKIERTKAQWAQIRELKQQVAKAPKADAQPEQTWGRAIESGVMNIPSSGAQFASDIVQPVLHPINTAKSLWELASNPEARAAVGEHYKSRYGSEAGLKETVATDPIGMAADLATLLTGGGAIAARGPSIVGKVGRVAQKAGAAVDPLRLASVAAKGTGKAVASTLGITTGKGTRAVQEVAKAGAEGGEAAKAAKGQMRGTVPQSDLLIEARANLDNIRRQRQTQYRAGMANIKNDKTVLDFQPILDEVADVAGAGKFKGEVIEQSAANTVKAIEDAVLEWGAKNPAEFHTPEGLDALKRQIWDIADAQSVKPGTNAARVVSRAYNAVKQQIQKQAPEYSKVMGDYENAAEQVREIERALSLGDQASADTAMRKLTSIMRDNVQTNFGQRVQLAEQLDQRGTLIPGIVGAQFKELEPSGLARYAGPAAVGSAAMATGDLKTLGALPFMSPRLVGEAAYAAGTAARPIIQIQQLLEQSGINPRVAELLAYQISQASQNQQPTTLQELGQGR